MFQKTKRAVPAIAAIALSGALLLAGCAASPPGVATVDGGSPSSTAEPDAGPAAGDSVKFAECMREHGIDVPDPEEGNKGGAVQFALPRDTDSTAMGEAMEACKQHLPNGGEPMKLDPEQLAEARKFSACMRENGIEDFPDPNPDGGIMIEGGAIEVDAEFEAAQDACAAHLPMNGEGPGQSSGGGAP